MLTIVRVYKLYLLTYLLTWGPSVFASFQLLKNDDVMDLIVVFCILSVFMLVLYCFCVATDFSVNKDLYISYHLQCFPDLLYSWEKKQGLQELNRRNRCRTIM